MTQLKPFDPFENLVGAAPINPGNHETPHPSTTPATQATEAHWFTK